MSVVVNVGIEADPLFNLVGRIRGPNVSPGALRSMVTRHLRTFTVDLEEFQFMSKDLPCDLPTIFVWILFCPCGVPTYVLLLILNWEYLLYPH